MDKIPIEIIDCIIEYIDYLKYHKKNFKNVLKDIEDISKIFIGDDNLPPDIISYCWGNHNITYTNNYNEDTNYLEYSDNESIDSYS